MNKKKIISTLFALAIVATSANGALGADLYSTTGFGTTGASVAGATTANQNFIGNFMAQIQRLREVLSNLPSNAGTSTATSVVGSATNATNTAGATTTNPNAVAGTAIATPVIPAGSFVNYGTINIGGGLGMGSHGFNVAALQAMLAANPSIYPQGLVTGFFGPATFDAVTRFQSMFGLPPVGFVGPLTLGKIRLAFDQMGLMQVNAGTNNPQICVAPGHLIASGWTRLIASNNKIFVGLCALQVNESGTPVPFNPGTGSISNVNVSGITLSGAQVNWNFNLAGVSPRVVCSTTSPVDVNNNNNLNFSASDNATSVNLSGLNANTQYFCVVRATDASGNVFTSNEFNFTTSQDQGNNQGNINISGISFSNITSGAATLAWNTDANSSSVVMCSTTNPIDVDQPGNLIFMTSGLVSAHSVSLTNLEDNTTYYCVVRSVDADGNVATSGQVSFTTTQTNQDNLTISGINTSNLTSTGARVDFNTNLNATSQIICSTTSPVDVNNNNNLTFSGSGSVTSQSIDLTNLSPNTQYFCVVRATDANNNVVTSSQFDFTTSQEADTTAPQISNVASGNITASGANITWTTDENASSIVLCSTTNPIDVNNSNNLSFNTSGSFTSHSVNATNLSANTAYFCVVRSVDAAGNVATSAQFNFTTSQADTADPVISGITVNNVSGNSATISWTTDESASSKVYFDNAPAVDINTAASVTGADSVTSHSVNLTGLTPNTTYYFIIESTDANNNTALSTEQSFTTTQ